MNAERQKVMELLGKLSSGRSKLPQLKIDELYQSDGWEDRNQAIEALKANDVADAADEVIAILNREWKPRLRLIRKFDYIKSNWSQWRAERDNPDGTITHGFVDATSNGETIAHDTFEEEQE